MIEIPLDVTMASGKFALHISSDQPILGSVFSRTLSQGKRDFVWSTSAQDLTDFTLATTGLAPTLVFTGNRIKVDLELTIPMERRRRSPFLLKILQRMWSELLFARLRSREYLQAHQALLSSPRRVATVTFH